MEGEDRVAYDNLSAEIFDDIRPKDALEFIWAREIIDLTWEILRYRRHVIALFATRASDGLSRTLSPYVRNFLKLQELVTEWAQKKEDAVLVVDQILDHMQLGKEAIAAETFRSLLSEMETIMRLQSITEARRINIFREIDRRRESFSRQLRAAIEAREADPRHSVPQLTDAVC